MVMSGGQWGEWLSVRVSDGRYGLVVIVGGEWWLVVSRLVVTRIRSGHLSVVTSIIIFVCGVIQQCHASRNNLHL